MTHSRVHRCECPLCQSSEPHPEQAFHHHMNVFLSRLNEPQRRWFVALEAMRLGHGGKHLLMQITDMSPTTILRGRHELEADLAGCPELHMRAPGGGRPAAEERDHELEDALETVLALETAGDPMGRRPKAKRSSLRHLSAALEKKGHAVSRPTVSKLPRNLKSTRGVPRSVVHLQPSVMSSSTISMSSAKTLARQAIPSSVSTRKKRANWRLQKRGKNLAQGGRAGAGA